MLGDRLRQLSDGWELAGTAPGAHPGPDGLDTLEWVPARVPGTVAGALRRAGRAQPDDLDDRDWWFRTAFAQEPVGEGEAVTLRLEGLATLAEVYLNGALVLEGESMFTAHEVDVGDHLQAENELLICCRALTPRLAVRRRPRARWRTRLVAHGNLRFFRTMILGRAPGFAGGPAVVGPWRPVSVRRQRAPALLGLQLRAACEGRDGVLAARVIVRRPTAGAPLELAIDLDGPTGRRRQTLGEVQAGDGEAAVDATILVPEPVRWWPHTHGAPSRYRVTVRLQADGRTVAETSKWVGFRTLTAGEHLERDGLALHVNGVPVFARGAVWTPADLTAPHGEPAELRRLLEAVRDAGMNMIRIPGTACYESDAFHDLCDELGILVWQDFMFANLDYPESDAEFMRAVADEVGQVLDRIAWRPSLAVLCGGSEVAQQVAMLGLDPELANGPLYTGLLPRLVARTGTDAVYIPSSPWGGELPFRPARGVAHYFGVGAYLRPLEDARRAEVKFASECLAFANVPDDHPTEPIGSAGLGPHVPRWKAGVPRDVGAGWDFEDVRDHYLRLLFEVDPVLLRSQDIDRYLELSRLTSGEVMAEVLGEWRRRQSPCGGALLLWLKDLFPGPGWGVLDHRGRPKLCYHHLRRTLAPVAVWSTDEGLGGILAHVANDRPEPLAAQLRVALYRDLELPVAEESVDVELGPHSATEHDLERVLGRFTDVSWAYRFGAPAQDLVALSLELPDRGPLRPVARAFRLPAGRPIRAQRPAALGLRAGMGCGPDGQWTVRLRAERFVYGCRLRVPGFVPEDDGFSLEPGHPLEVGLVAVDDDAARGLDDDPARAGEVTAVNLAGRVAVQRQEGS